MNTNTETSAQGIQYQRDASVEMSILKYLTPEEYLEGLADSCPKVGGFDMVEMVKGYERGLAIFQGWLDEQKQANTELLLRSLTFEDTSNRLGVNAARDLLNEPVLAFDIKRLLQTWTMAGEISDRMALPTRIVCDATTNVLHNTKGVVHAAFERQQHSVQKALDLFDNWLETLRRMARAGAATVH